LTPSLGQALSGAAPDLNSGVALLAMALVLLFELTGKSRRHPRRLAVVGGIAGRAGRAWRAAAASVIAVPRSVRMAFADPAAIATDGAGRHQRSGVTGFQTRGRRGCQRLAARADRLRCRPAKGRRTGASTRCCHRNRCWGDPALPLEKADDVQTQDGEQQRNQQTGPAEGADRL
jgi:hypothetical protein